MGFTKKTFIEKMKSMDFSKKEYDTEGLPLIKISYSQVVARPLFYPENQFSKFLACLAGAESFSKHQVLMLQEMGFKLEISTRHITLEDVMSRGT